LEVFSELKGKKFYIAGESVSLLKAFFPNFISNEKVNEVCGEIFTL
jgi:hypothetical protein